MLLHTPAKDKTSFSIITYAYYHMLIAFISVVLVFFYKCISETTNYFQSIQYYHFQAL